MWTLLLRWAPSMVPGLIEVADQIGDYVSPWVADHPKLALALACVALVLNHVVPTPSETIHNAVIGLSKNDGPKADRKAPVVQ